MFKREVFPQGQERKNTVKLNQAKINAFKEKGIGLVIDSGHYSWVNSPLDGQGVEGEPFYDSFKDVLPSRTLNMKNYIEGTLKERKGEAIGVEFGGVGTRLFSGFSPNFLAKSVSVSLVDHRKSHMKEAMDKQNKKINHTLLIGDIFSDETYEKLNDLLKGEKIDLIMERMAAGLDFVPKEPYEASRVLKIWYKLLREGGVMFVQIPSDFNNLVEEWVAKIKKEYSGVLEIQSDINMSRTHTSSIRLKKLAGAPEELPMLDPRIVKETRKVW